ncbi:MAG TPA: hypothetical protein VFZ83_12815 [Acidimicrobiia bacterium]|nr:hypothetical protein [Acidimicrobiia bacterium]
MKLDPATATFLGTGVSLDAGIVHPSGDPITVRAWGARPNDDGTTVRVLLPTDDPDTVEHVHPGGLIALVASDVITFRSIQLKGRVVAHEPESEADEALHTAYVDAFAAAVQEADGTPESLVRRLVPAGRAAVTFTVEQAFDQTPGPGAGGRLEPGPTDGPRQRA